MRFLLPFPLSYQTPSLITTVVLELFTVLDIRKRRELFTVLNIPEKRELFEILDRRQQRELFQDLDIRLWLKLVKDLNYRQQLKLFKQGLNSLWESCKQVDQIIEPTQNRER